MEEDEKAAGYAEAVRTKCCNYRHSGRTRTRQWRKKNENATDIWQLFFFPWQSNGEKVGENAGRQPDAIRFDVIGWRRWNWAEVRCRAIRGKSRTRFSWSTLNQHRFTDVLRRWGGRPRLSAVSAIGRLDNVNVDPLQRGQTRGKGERGEERGKATANGAS